MPACGMFSKPFPCRNAIVRFLGAQPPELIPVSWPVLASQYRPNKSPPIPQLSGSTTPSTALAAMAASMAVPPRAKTCAPACEASVWLVATMPRSEMTMDRAWLRSCATAGMANMTRSSNRMVPRSYQPGGAAKSTLLQLKLHSHAGRLDPGTGLRFPRANCIGTLARGTGGGARLRARPQGWRPHPGHEAVGEASTRGKAPHRDAGELRQAAVGRGARKPPMAVRRCGSTGAARRGVDRPDAARTRPAA